LVLGFAVVALAAGCQPTLVGSAKQVTVTPQVEEFDRLEVSQEIAASVTRGEARALEISINENLAERLRVRVVGGRLHIGMDEDYQYDGLRAEARVVTPLLVGVELSGAARAQLAGFEQVSVGRFAAEVSGASRLTGGVAADEVRLDLSGASRAELSGVARALSLEASGASRAELLGLPADRAMVALSGASRAALLVAGNVRGEATGASSLVVGGGALVMVETSGGSSISRR
jgi:hypothetical protein